VSEVVAVLGLVGMRRAHRVDPGERARLVVHDVHSDNAWRLVAVGLWPLDEEVPAMQPVAVRSQAWQVLAAMAIAKRWRWQVERVELGEALGRLTWAELLRDADQRRWSVRWCDGWLEVAR
jgi:hypothetical protein